MKSFNTSNGGTERNPFNNITDEQFDKMIEEGFEPSSLNCYAHLTGDTCYTKSFESKNGWWITCYVTEHGTAVDYDYNCGGNVGNTTWWFKDGEYTLNEFNYSTFNYEDILYKKYGQSFESAWDEMVEYSQNL